MRQFWLAFVSMFVAVDPIGMLPVFMGMVGNLDQKHLRQVIVQSITTALIVAFAFLLIGNQVLKMMGVEISDFLVAGGVLLFVIALADLVSADTQRKTPPDHETIGAVPLGVPLIVGPGVLATSLVLLDQYGSLITSAAIAANVLLTGLVLMNARRILNLLGNAGSRVVIKLAALILAALAVMFIRRGVAMIVGEVMRKAQGE